MSFKEKKWNPNGWYFDEEKGKWIPPDYKQMKDGKFSPVYEAEHGAKSPTGWTYDRDTMKWNPPKELIEENKRRWRWDPEKQIWIDLYKRKEPEYDPNRTWYPNGWYFDKKLNKWVAPDYRTPEADQNGKWVYNEQVKMWVDKDQCDPVENRRRYEENRRKWADFERQETEREAERRRIQAILDEKRRPIHLTAEEKELAKQIRVEHKEPTYEEWKAAREAAKKEKEE